MENLFLSFDNLDSIYLYLILFFWGLSESLFNPLPVDLAIIYFIKEYNLNWFLVFLTALGSNFLGALISYWIGLKLMNLRFFRNILKKKAFKKIYPLYSKYSDVALFLSTFTPLPYKIFTYFSGMVKMNLIIFTIYSIIGRGARFFLVAYLSSKLSWIQILILAIILIPIYFLTEHFIKRKFNI